MIMKTMLLLLMIKVRANYLNSMVKYRAKTRPRLWNRKDKKNIAALRFLKSLSKKRKVQQSPRLEQLPIRIMMILLLINLSDPREIAWFIEDSSRHSMKARIEFSWNIPSMISIRLCLIFNLFEGKLGKKEC